MRLAGVFRTGFVVVFLTTFLTSVWGSTGGVTNVGGFSSSAEHFTGVRKWVELDGRGGMLKGSPPHDVLKFITVYAPGVTRGHLLFRELKTFDGRLSFLLTAPDDLVDRIKRVTLYFQAQSDALELYEQVEGDWIKHLPQLLRVADAHDDGGPPQSLLAFSVEKPGFFWVMESSTPQVTQPSFVPQDPSAQSLMGGSLLWGFSAGAASIVLLSLGGLISRRLHTSDQLLEE